MKVYNSLIERLRSQHESLAVIISGIDQVRLHKSPAENKWSIHDNITHLATYQPVFIERINRILLEDNPAFNRYKAEDDPEFENWRGRNTGDLVSQIQIDRVEIFDLITKLSETESSRTGIHPKFGQMDILRWTEFFLLHEAHHLFTIFQLAYGNENIKL